MVSMACQGVAFILACPLASSACCQVKVPATQGNATDKSPESYYQSSNANILHSGEILLYQRLGWKALQGWKALANSVLAHLSLCWVLEERGSGSRTARLCQQETEKNKDNISAQMDVRDGDEVVTCSGLRAIGKRIAAELLHCAHCIRMAGIIAGVTRLNAE
jgi:hypothetical protein